MGAERQKGEIKMVKWTKIRVIDNGGMDQGALKDFLGCQENRLLLETATISEDGIESWPDFLLCEANENPNHNTPHCDVDWSGFLDFLANVFFFAEYQD
jgi:hypothetical protein